MAIKSDNPLDQAIEKNKRDLSALQIKMQSLISSFLQLPPKERAKRLQEVTNSLLAVQKFLDQSKSSPVTNAGSRFGLENLKSTFSNLSTRWRKFEKSLGEISE